MAPTVEELTRYGRLGFGSANAGNLFQTMSDEQAHALFAAAWDAGVRHFDTAPHYGLGLAEERLGAFLRTKPRDEYHLSTKIGRLIVATEDPVTDAEGYDLTVRRIRQADYTADGVRRSLADSLQRLGLDRVDAIYIHDPEHLGDEHTAEHLATAVPACRELKDAGVVRHIGVGTCSVPTAQAAVDHGGIDVLMLAGGFTLLTHPAHPRLLASCGAAGVQILATAPFNSGLLATHPPRRDSHFAYGDVPDEQFTRALALAEVCERHGVELPSAALQFPLQYGECVAVVTGAADPDQVRQTVARMDDPIPTALWDELRREGSIP